MTASDYNLWLKAKVGDFVQVSDQQAIEHSMKNGTGIDGLNYRIKEILEFKEARQLCSWVFCELEDEEDQLYLVAKNIDDELTIILYYVEPEIEPGSRRELLDEGFDFLFNEFDTKPSNLDDLEFSSEIFVNNEDENGESFESSFRQKRQGALFAESTTKVKTALKSCVVEYRTMDEIENPEMMIYESWVANGQGCEAVSFLRGSELATSEVELMLL